MIGAVLPGFSAKSYKNILGANDKLRVSVMGVHMRGNALARNFSAQKQCGVIHICDVDARSAAKTAGDVEKVQGARPVVFGDFRKSLEDKDVDIMVIATPDHWHAPAALLALQAGKHVYVEKPISHNPAEGEMLVQAVAYYGKALQLGTQRRSWPNVVAAIEEIKTGTIGRPYYAKSWYNNNRPSIGTGKVIGVPEWLDWELWQGPAPREAYKDNIVHYKWHWRWNWGTGEALNNGTHMIDLIRWGLGVDYPVRVSSNGGRYRYKDDWETPDTQIIGFDFAERASCSWEGRSCNGKKVEGTSVGVEFYGEKGSIQIAGGNSYKVFDLESKLVKEVKSEIPIDARNTVSPASYLDALHIQNLFNHILKGEELKADVLTGHKSTLLVQLGNIALRAGHSLDINPENGHILTGEEAKKLWARKYEKGWEMKFKS